MSGEKPGTGDTHRRSSVALLGLKYFSRHPGAARYALATGYLLSRLRRFSRVAFLLVKARKPQPRTTNISNSSNLTLARQFQPTHQGRKLKLTRGEVMKKILSIMVTGCLLALMVAFAVEAQEPGTAMRGSIPFEFIVSGRTLPSGNYEIRRLSDDSMTLIIQNVDHRRDEAVFTTDAHIESGIPGRSEIVFHRYGDTTFLSE